ncbi:MAG TPA: AI-2E family transporter [Flavipsychrobacter sp.]|nr:AI-2E family transporter [Flavipsychrobacter sp.]
MKELPNTVKRSIELVGLCAVAYIITAGRDVITPILMAFFLSILLLPLYRVLRKYKFPEVLAIFFSILAAALVLAGVGWFFSMQIARLLSDIPQIQDNLNGHWKSISSWINAKTQFSSHQQLEWLRMQSQRLVGNAGSYLSGAALTLTGVFVFVGLLPIYTFLIMYYKNLLLRFTFLWFKPEQHATVQTTLTEAQSIIMSYLVGLMIQITYITILLGGLLAILGIKHALLIGVIFAFLNLIPYVGALVGNLIGALLTLTSSQDLTPILIVLGSIAAVQFLDNNILMPRIVGSKVKLNALASILGVIIGGSLAGVAGMFLSLPVMAVLKIIFDNSDSFRQWGILLGDEKPKKSPMSIAKLKMRRGADEPKKP